MPIGFQYRCEQCGHDWVLFSKHFTLGPVQWGAIEYTCYSCQSFLSVAATIDANSWSKWLRNNEAMVQQHRVLAELSKSIESRLKLIHGLAPITIELDSIACPTCRNPMSTVPFGQHRMRCPKCQHHAGVFDQSDGIDIYGMPNEGGNSD